MSDDWDAEDIEIPTIPPLNQGSWDDEDAEDDMNVKASWDDEDESEEEKPKEQAKTTSAAPKKKKTLKEKIAEKQEAEERRKAELAAKAQAKAEEPDETPEERKARLQKAVLESDMQNTRDLFSGLAVTSTDETSKIETMVPESRVEFDEYVKLLGDKLHTFQDSTHYTYFVENLLRSLMVPLSVDDSRKISSVVTAMVSEKQKAQKDASKKKKPKKASLKTGPSGAYDTANYDDVVYDEYDDFM
ncbi:eukaryotic translation initiation factor 3 subunit J [Gaertneriomyces semiglobifer]|nr:eukaryotic translation initiation factor 3 subunit J [Gaertneriomyces semiglobifer]